jgi:predicted nucleotidyltransferase
MLELLFSSTARVKVLALLLLNSDTRFYQRQISKLTELPVRAVQREVERLQTLGLLIRAENGNQVHYQVNRDFFLFSELKSIFLKTLGVMALTQNALRGADGILLAFIYGSYAADQETANSDIDVLVVGSLSSRALHTALQDAEQLTQREINYALFSADEFRARVRAGDGFLTNVLAAPKLFLIGDDDALRSFVA